MNVMLSEEQLTGLLAEAAAELPVPELALEAPQPRRTAWWQRRRWQASAAAAMVVTATVLLQSVVGGSGTTTQDAQKSLGTAGVNGAARESAPLVGSGGPAAAPGAPVTGHAPALLPAAPGATAADATVPAPDGARVVKTGSITLSVDRGKLSATLDRLEPLAKGYGGYVSDSSSQETGDHPSATVTIRVPSGRFEDLVGQVRALAKVISWETSGKDVTGDYTDLQAQLQSLRAARSRYLVILSGARTIAETLTVQQRVDDVQRQIDQLEGQRRLLADQSDLGTLTVTVGEKADQQLVTPAPSGWSKAWDDAVHGFTGGLQGLLAASGTALLVLLVGAVLVVLGRLGWRRARRRLV